MAGVSEHPNHLPCQVARTVAASQKPLRETATRRQTQNTDSAETRKCLILFGLRHFEVGKLWMRKWRGFRGQGAAGHTVWKC